MNARPSQPNAQAKVQEVLQPLLGSAQQTPPSTSSTPQAVANLGAAEYSSQGYATVTNKSNSTENLEVFLLSAFHFCIRLGLVVIFLLDVIFLAYVSVLGPRESVFDFRAWSTCSVIYSFCSSQTCCESCVIILCFSFFMVMLVFSWLFGKLNRLRSCLFRSRTD